MVIAVGETPEDHAASGRMKRVILDSLHALGCSQIFPNASTREMEAIEGKLTGLLLGWKDSSRA